MGNENGCCARNSDGAAAIPESTDAYFTRNEYTCAIDGGLIKDGFDYGDEKGWAKRDKNIKKMNAAVNELMEALDTDNNGKINKAELKANKAKMLEILKKAGHDKAADANEMEENLLALCDADGDGTLDKSEVVNIVSGLACLSPENSKRMYQFQKKMQNWDSSQDGVVCAKEIDKIVDWYVKGLNPTTDKVDAAKAKAKAALGALDKNEDREFSVREIFFWYCDACKEITKARIAQAQAAKKKKEAADAVWSPTTAKKKKEAKNGETKSSTQ